MKEFLKQFGIGYDQQVTQIGSEYYVLSPAIMRVKDAIRQTPVFAGQYLGAAKDRIFQPSTELLQWMVKRTERRVVLNEKGAWLFVCGRDPFKQGVSKSPTGLNEGTLVLALNEVGECLGYGQYTGKGGMKPFVKNIYDIGDFLRRESSKKRLLGRPKR